MNSGAESGNCNHYEIVSFLGSMIWALSNVEADRMVKHVVVVVVVKEYDFNRRTQRSFGCSCILLSEV